MKIFSKKRNYPFTIKIQNFAINWRLFFFIIFAPFLCYYCLEAEETGTNGNAIQLPPQPTLVAGDIESLIPLAETNYLDGKPVLLFSGANQARNPLSLFEFSNSVVFHQDGFMGLCLELFPETGTVTTNIEVNENIRKAPRYRFAAGKEPLEIDISGDGYYEIFAQFKGEMQNASAKVILDNTALIPSPNTAFEQRDTTRWQGFPGIYLTKGVHTFTVNEAVEDLIIVPQKVFQDYVTYVKDLFQKKQVSYLFCNDEKKEEPPSGTKISDGKTTTFITANPGKYQLLAYVSPVNEEIQFRNIGLKVSGGDLMSNAPIVKDTAGNEAAILPFSHYNLDIEEYPYLKVTYNLADRKRTMLGFLLELDTDDDDAVDTMCFAGNIRYELKPYITINMADIHLKEKDFWYKVNRELGRTIDAGMHQWYYDARGSGFSRNREGNTLAVSSDFSQSNHFVITKHFKPVNVKENQILTLEYKMDNPHTQKIGINFRIDTDGNGRPDRTIETNYTGSASVTKDGFSRQEINVLIHSGISPHDEKSVCNLVEVILLFSGAGKFYLKDFGIGNQEIVVPDEIRRYCSEREMILNNKIREDDDSWTQKWRKKDIVPLNMVILNGEEKREKGETVFIINDILQQVQNTMKNTYYCKLKGFIPLLYLKKGLPGTISLWKDSLEEVLKEVEFFNFETIEVPKFIAETKTKKEWEQKLEEETLQYGIEKAVYRKDWGKEQYDIEEYAADEWFGIHDIKETMTSLSETNHWKIQGVNSIFNFTRFMDGIEVAFYLDGSKEEDEKVIFIPKTVDFQDVNLREGISFDVSYELSDSAATELVLYIGVDFDGDKKEDATFRLTPSSIEDKNITGRKIKVACFDTTRLLNIYPEKEKQNLSSFILSVEKKQGTHFIGTNRTVKKVFLHEVKTKKKRQDDDEGVRLVVYADKDGKPLLKSLPDSETLHTLDFLAKIPPESSTFLKNGWELKTRNTSYQLSYGKEGLNIQGLFYCSGHERYLTLKKYLNGIDLRKYPFVRFKFQTAELTEPGDINHEKLWIEFRGKCSQKRNFFMKMGGSRFREDQDYCVNLFKELKKIYPDSNTFVLDDITVAIDPTVGRFDERLLSYSSDVWMDDKETQISVKALQIFGTKENDIDNMLKKMLVREAESSHTRFFDEITWTSGAIANTKFQHKNFGDEQYLRAHFKDDGFREEGIILTANFKQPVESHLTETVNFEYSIEDTDIQGIAIVPEFDNTYRSSSISFLNLQQKTGHLSCNIREKIKDISTESETSPARLTSLLFFLVKKPGINCRENNQTNTYTFSIKNISTTTTTTTTTTIYEQLLSEPLLEFNGRRYKLEDGFKIKDEKLQLKDKETNEIPAARRLLTMAEFVSLGRTPFCLDEIDVSDGENRLTLYPPSKYLKVEMAEIVRHGKNPYQNTTRHEPEITFKKINPTRYVVNVKGEKPFWLVFSESFHAGWKAYVRQRSEVGGRRLESKTEHWSALISAWRDKGRRIELTEHQMVNGYANGWYVPVGQKAEVGGQRSEDDGGISGDFQIVLEYKPQRLFEIGVLISGITFVSCIGYLCWGGIRRLVG
ncbi:MAG: hypothetical protein E3K37_13430 [Candidatus Kuenenia sp.]|nr:hypothetical protein [Candidatus Kuenenia hertensis]